MNPEIKANFSATNYAIATTFKACEKVVDKMYSDDTNPNGNGPIDRFNRKRWTNIHNKHFDEWVRITASLPELTSEEVAPSVRILVDGKVLTVEEATDRCSAKVLWPYTAFIGMPGTGKTTLADGVVNYLKSYGIDLTVVKEAKPFVRKDRWSNNDWMYTGHSTQLFLMDIYKLLPHILNPASLSGPRLFDRGIINQMAFAQANKALNLHLDALPPDEYSTVINKAAALLSRNISGLVIFDCSPKSTLERIGAGRIITPDYLCALSEAYRQLPQILSTYRGNLPSLRNIPLLTVTVDADQDLDAYRDTVMKTFGTIYKYFS